MDPPTRLGRRQHRYPQVFVAPQALQLLVTSAEGPGVVSHQASSWRVPRHLAKKAASATQMETIASNPFAMVRYRMYLASF